MHLYKHLSKHYYRKWINRAYEKEIIWALNLNVGDLVYTCKGFNEPISKVEPVISAYHNGWFIADCEIVTINGGNCSLRYCIERPKSKQEIESIWLESFSKALNNGAFDEKQKANYIEIISLLKNHHLLNEDGTINKEYCYLLEH